MAGYIGDIPSGTLSGLPMGNTQTDPGIQKVMELMQLLQTVSQPPVQPQPPEGMLEWSDNPFANWGQRLGRGAQLAFTPATKLKDAALKRKIYMDQMSAYNDQIGQYQSGQNQFAGQAALELLQGQHRMDVAGVRATTPNRASRLSKSEWVNDAGHRLRQWADPFTGEILPVVDPNTGELVDQLDLGPALVTPFIQPAIPGVSGPVRVPRLGPAGPVADGVTPPPPPNIVNALAMDKASLEAIGMMDTAWQTLQQKTKGQTLIGKLARERVGSSRYGGAFNQTRDYAAYRSVMANSLNAYVKAQTGAQFSIKEMDRYASLYPEAWDDVELKNTKMESLRQRAVADMREKVRNYPAAAETGAGTPSTSNPVDDILNEWDATHAQTP